MIDCLYNRNDRLFVQFLNKLKKQWNLSRSYAMIATSIAVCLNNVSSIILFLISYHSLIESLIISTIIFNHQSSLIHKCV